MDISCQNYMKKIIKITDSNENIKLLHVKAHTNNKDYFSLGNNMADKFAEEGCIKCFNLLDI